jgi:hypothetical protein
VDIRSFAELDDAWFTALALHNMLLDKGDEYEFSEVVGSAAAQKCAVAGMPEDALSVLHNPMRAKLVESFWFQFREGRVFWPSRPGSRGVVKKFTLDDDDTDETLDWIYRV